MNEILQQISDQIFKLCNFQISNFEIEAESKEYHACRFRLNGRTIISRNAKITPKKMGQFVTFWKRIGSDPIQPFSATDPFDLFSVTVQTQSKCGQFVFPKSILIKKGILTSATKEGKRAFRVYPPWDSPKSKQAIQTQQWQLTYFYQVGETTDVKKVIELYAAK